MSVHPVGRLGGIMVSEEEVEVVEGILIWTVIEDHLLLICTTSTHSMMTVMFPQELCKEDLAEVCVQPGDLAARDSEAPEVSVVHADHVVLACEEEEDGV